MPPSPPPSPRKFNISNFAVLEPPFPFVGIPDVRRFTYGIIRKDNRIWFAGVEIVASGKSANLYTHFGIEGGKMQTSTTIVVPKAKRTIVEQALLELTSKYRTKMSKTGFDFSTTVESAKDTRILPMLAHEFVEKFSKDKVKFPVFIQPKLDGVRLLVDVVQSSPGVYSARFSSRGRKNYDHLTPLYGAEALALLARLPENSILDGELVMPRDDGTAGEDFQEVTSAARTTKALTEAAKERMVYTVFTFYSHSFPNLTCAERLEILSNAFGDVKPLKIRLVKTRLARSEEEIYAALEEFTSPKMGHEGVMVYTQDGIYRPDHRSTDLLKLKKFFSDEGRVVALHAGKGREAKAANVEIDIGGGKTVIMHPEGSIEEREKWLAKPSLVVGKMMTYTYQEKTKAGIPRFPVARVIRDYE